MSGTKTKIAVLCASVLLAAAGGVTTWAVGQTPTPKAEEPAKPAAVPVVPAAVKKAEPRYADYFDRTRSFNRTRRIGLAIQNYHDEHGRMPADITDATGKPILSWRVTLLPYLDEGFLATQFKTDEPWDGEHNKKLLSYVPNVFRTPGVGAGETRVNGFSGPGTAFEPGKRLTLQDVTDGTSLTLAFVEAGPAVPWTKPADLPFDPAGPVTPPSGPFADGFVGVWLDGSARWLPPDVDPRWLKLLIQRADGDFPEEPIGKPQSRRQLTDREKIEMAQVKARFARTRGVQERQVEERFRLTETLRKAGTPLVPDPPADDDLWAWTQAYHRLHNTQQSDLSEVSRLWQELEKRDPQAAARLRKELAAPK